MRKLIVLAMLLAAATVMIPYAQAQTCPSGYFNMLDWMTLNTATTQHLNGPQSLPLYTVLPSNGEFWWIKGDHSGQGYPWDLQYYDSNNIYNWITDWDPNSYSDPHYFKAFDSKTGLAWTPICVPALGPGNKLSSISVPNADTAYHDYGPNCTKGSTTNYLGNTVNEVWNYGNLNIGGNIGTQPDLQLSYRYTCDSNYSNCKYKEVYDFMQNYGEVRWTYYVLTNGAYVQNNQTIFNQVLSGGSPAPYFPCGLP